MQKTIWLVILVLVLVGLAVGQTMALTKPALFQTWVLKNICWAATAAILVSLIGAAASDWTIAKVLAAVYLTFVIIPTLLVLLNKMGSKRKLRKEGTVAEAESGSFRFQRNW